MMNKAEIIAKWAEFGDTTKVDAERNVETLCKVLEYAVESREGLKLLGYLTLEVVETKERIGRNPQTKEEVTIPAGRKVKIKSKKVLNDLAK